MGGIGLIESTFNGPCPIFLITNAFVFGADLLPMRVESKQFFEYSGAPIQPLPCTLAPKSGALIFASIADTAVTSTESHKPLVFVFGANSTVRLIVSSFLRFTGNVGIFKIVNVPLFCKRLMVLTESSLFPLFVITTFF